MRILFIGEQSLQNEAILEVLTSEVTQEIRPITPGQLKNNRGKVLDDDYQFIIIDLISSPAGSDEQLQKMIQSKASGYLVGISDHQSDSSINQTQEPGIDYHFSLDSDTKVLLQLFTESYGT